MNTHSRREFVRSTGSANHLRRGAPCERHGDNIIDQVRRPTTNSQFYVTSFARTAIVDTHAIFAPEYLGRPILVSDVDAARCD